MELIKPALAVSTGSTAVVKTGTWRTMRPHYVHLTAPCRAACPTGEDIPQWMNLTREGRFQDAWACLVADNPLPAVTGRVCYHPCESACNRLSYDGALAVNAVERFLADCSVEAPLPFTALGYYPFRVAVVGSGPAGLSAAFQIARFGYQVTLFEAAPELGGVLRYGIPEYRLPKDVLDREVNRILQLGIQVETSRRLGVNLGEADLAAFDAVVLAIGAMIGRRLGVPVQDDQMLDGVHFLRRVHEGQATGIAGSVVVVGGGSTAIDVARTARRLGADVAVIALEGVDEMPAVPEEVREAIAEGVEFRHQSAVVEVLRDHGRTTGVRCSAARLDITDDGEVRAVILPGADINLAADEVISAIGQQVDLAALPFGVTTTRGMVDIDEYGRTSREGVFAAGDMTAGRRSVVHAIGCGKRAAVAVDALLRRGRSTPPPDIRLGDGPSISMSHYHANDSARNALVEERIDRVVPFSGINLDYFPRRARAVRQKAPVEARVRSFEDTTIGLTSEQARAEAGRCFNCGTCIQCDNCLIFCPDVAIRRSTGPSGYEVLLEFCKGCGACVEECPRGALVLEVDRA